MLPVHVTARSVASSVGVGCDVLADALWRKRSGLRPSDFDATAGGGFIGRVEGVESQPLPAIAAALRLPQPPPRECRAGSGRLRRGRGAGRARYGADRVAVLVGTSTSGILTTETAYRERQADGALPPGSTTGTPTTTARCRISSPRGWG